MLMVPDGPVPGWGRPGGEAVRGTTTRSAGWGGACLVVGLARPCL